MTKPRLTKPGVTDLEWMHVVCTPETTHVEFHEDADDAMDAARANLAPSCSTYVGRVTHQGEHRNRLDYKVCVLEVRVDEALREALRRSAAEDGHKLEPGRKALQAYLRGLLVGQLDAIRAQHRRMRALYSEPQPHSKFEPFRPWAKCKSIDECEAMGRCCNGCQGRL